MGPNRTLRVALFSLVLAGPAALAGCGGTPEAPPSEAGTTLTPLPPRPTSEETFDYTQRPLATMEESERAAYIEKRFPLPRGIAETESVPTPGAPPGDEYDHRLRIAGTRPQRVLDPWVYDDPRLWTAIGPEYSPYTEGRVVVARRWEPMPIANTLFFGTLGGIIGHQSDHRDEGILIGGTYGLLLDLLRW